VVTAMLRMAGYPAKQGAMAVTLVGNYKPAKRGNYHASHGSYKPCEAWLL